MISLEIKERNKNESLLKLRQGGLLPAVFYGKKETSTSISISLKDFQKVWNEAGESAVITLKKGGGANLDALIYDVDIDPVTELPRHVDFYVFEKDKKIEVDASIKFVGIAPAVKEQGGVLVKVLYELKVEALPKDLPSEIDVDISVLKEIGDRISAKDIKLPAGVSLVENPEEIVASVSAPKEEEVVPEPVDISDIEVEKKGKEKEESEETPAGEEKTTEKTA
jgi:large subunit ribosomal protein L25